MQLKYEPWSDLTFSVHLSGYLDTKKFKTTHELFIQHITIWRQMVEDAIQILASSWKQDAYHMPMVGNALQILEHYQSQTP